MVASLHPSIRFVLLDVGVSLGGMPGFCSHGPFPFMCSAYMYPRFKRPGGLDWEFRHRQSLPVYLCLVLKVGLSLSSNAGPFIKEK